MKAMKPVKHEETLQPFSKKKDCTPVEYTYTHAIYVGTLKNDIFRETVKRGVTFFYSSGITF